MIQQSHSWVFTQNNTNSRGFPDGAVVGNQPASAGVTGSSPGPGRFPHAVEQLGPWATATEPTCHNYWSSHA